ncbi:MAG: dihydroorotase [Chitinophagaceae bacterium]|nr:MAG: dihydroorotase [Chitinophagaceae bacterium]
MKVLIRQAKVFSSKSPFHLQTADILIHDGRIQQIAPHLEAVADFTEISKEGLCVSAGWMDVFADFADPGFEFRETIETGSGAAASGGFTAVMLLTSSSTGSPARSAVEYLINKEAPVAIYPIGSITVKNEGSQLAEMYDMHAAGAIAFSDGPIGLQHPGVMVKALQYVLPLNSSIIQVPGNRQISPNGLVNEGVQGTKLGLPGLPALAEEIMISRDIELLRYTGSRLHLTGISTKKGIALVRKAKEEGLNITCSVTPYHLNYTDADLFSYDTNLKVYPPLRTEEDLAELNDAVDEGLIDCLASHHFPWHRDEKDCEFEYSRFGMAGIQSVFGAAGKRILNTEKLIHLLTNGRNVFGLPVPEILEGEIADLTLFNPGETYTFAPGQNRSRSANNVFINSELRGRVYGTIHHNKIHLNK